MSTQEVVKGKGQAARNAAVKRLIAENSERFAEIYNEERKARDLFPVGTKQPTKAELEAEVERMKEILAQHGIQA